MAHHCIKILDTFADAVYRGEKTFEVRGNDRGYQRDDTVAFTVIRKDGTENIYHELYGRKYVITYVLSGWGIKDGYVVFGIKELTDAG